MRRLFVIGNPMANGGRLGAAFEGLSQRMGRLGFRMDFLLTERPLQAMDVAREVAGRYEIVVAAGGDGTVHEVANGLIASGVPGVALAVLPVGTGNDFAQAMGVAGLEEAVEALRVGLVAPVDALEVRSPAEGGGETRHAVLYAATGIAGGLTRLCTPGLKRVFGARYSYTIAVMRELLRFRPSLMRVTVDGQVHSRRMLLVSAGNAEIVGGGVMRLSPGARMDDGRFEVNLVDALTWREVPGCFLRLLRGTHTTHPKVRYFSATSLEVDSDVPLALQLDGEEFGGTPARITIRPRALGVIRAG